MVVKDTLYFLPSLSHLSLEQEQNFWLPTNDIGRVEDVDISVNGFDYTESPLGEFRANFVVKDVTGSFTVDAGSLVHEGTVRSFDSGTQVLEVSIEDKVRIDSEGNTVEGIRLEESLVNPEFVGSSVILDNDIVYGEEFNIRGW